MKKKKFIPKMGQAFGFNGLTLKRVPRKQLEMRKIPGKSKSSEYIFAIGEFTIHKTHDFQS